MRLKPVTQRITRTYCFNQDQVLALLGFKEPRNGYISLDCDGTNMVRVTVTRKLRKRKGTKEGG